MRFTVHCGAACNRVITDLIPKYSKWRKVFIEDLYINHEAYFGKLFDGFNLNWTAELQSYINQSTAKEKLGIYSSYGITKNIIGEWKKVMIMDETDLVQSLSRAV